MPWIISTSIGGLIAYLSWVGVNIIRLTKDYADLAAHMVNMNSRFDERWSLLKEIRDSVKRLESRDLDIVEKLGRLNGKSCKD